MDPSLRQPYALPPRFEWANSAHTDFRDAHIIVFEREVWVALTLPRQRGRGWEACTGPYREYLKVSRWKDLETEAGAVRWIATWVSKYADRIAAEVPKRRHRPTMSRRTREQLQYGR
ncbi:hypothetical protein J5226_12970 [Lysobacter sp. K5869]|uniref:hypothetical protein n=1 Tax=Lysobacter sp. K5869 TaxID=2820808 RepID=UPI001C05F952|nr:hypothetical protein [Lysobacter sp. K5869]QWP74612.1 hypothetical protein J5226_12970 [Lysobacter sp. K5869]